MEKCYIPPLKISLFIGIVSIIINVIGYTIYCLIINDFSYFTDCFDFSNAENKIKISIYFILYILFATSFQLTLFVSIFYFTPNLIMVTYIIRPLFSFIADAIIYGTSLEEAFLNPIGYLILLFSTLIYNEIIIFNCGGLDKNTKQFVNKRIFKELKEIKKAEIDLQYEIDDDDSLIINDNNDNNKEK